MKLLPAKKCIESTPLPHQGDFLRLLLSLLALVPAAVATAQGDLTAPAVSAETTAEGEDEDEGVIELSPFVVLTDRDIGYLSTNSTSGTSLNIALKDLPLSVQVINKEMIADLQASNLNESLGYTAGVFTSDNAATGSLNRGGPVGDDRSISSASGGRFGNRLYIRGLPTPYQNRNGFRNGGLVVTQNSTVVLGGLLDSVNIDRIEVVRGPNSLLYGVGVLTGIANVIAEKPNADPIYKASVAGGSEGLLRFTADATGPIFKKKSYGELNYRVAGSYEERDSYTDFAGSETEYLVGQLEYKWSRFLSLFFEYQHGVETRYGIGGRWINDAEGNNTEFRNEYDELYNWARQEGPIAGLRPVIASSYDPSVGVIINGKPNLQPGWKLGDEDFVGGGKDAETYRISGPDTWASREEDNYLIDLTLTPIEKLTISAGAFLTRQTTEELNVNMQTIGSQPQVLIADVARDDELNAIYQANRIYGTKMPDDIQSFFGLSNQTNSTTHPGTWVIPSITDDLKYVSYYWDQELVRAESQQFRLRAVYTLDHELFGTEFEHTFLGGFSYIKDDIDFPDGNLDNGNAQAKSDAYEVLDADGKPVLKPNGDPVIQASEYNGVIRGYPGGVPALPAGVTQQEIRNFDALHYRSIADFEPIRLGDSKIARAGDIYLNQEIEQQGKYFIYQGNFWNNRINLVLGLREDTYNARQFTHDRVNVDETFLLDGALNTVLFDASLGASGIPVPQGTPGFDVQATAAQVLEAIESAGKGVPASLQAEFASLNPSAPYKGSLFKSGVSVAQINNFADLIERSTATGGYITDFYRTQVEGANSGYYGLANRGGNPGETYGALPGTTYDIFEEDVSATSMMGGLSFQVTKELNVYGVYAEGISPNTALRDGSGAIIPAEEAVNKELGVKFDFDTKTVGRISGNFAVYTIDRSNGIWNLPIAPSPANWVDAGTSTNRANNWDIPTYDPSFPAISSIKAQYFIQYLSEAFGIPGEKIDLIATSGVGLVQQVEVDDLPGATRREKQLLQREIAQKAIIPNALATDYVSDNNFGSTVVTETVLFPQNSLDQLFEVTLYDVATQQYVTRTISSFGAIYSAFMDRDLDPTKNDLLQPLTPINYAARLSGMPNDNNQPDIRNGALVTFDETINGLETEIFWTPNDNWQFIFGFSHVERQANDDFAYADYESIVGTEINGFIGPFTETYREFGWANADVSLAWVNYSAYAAARSAATGPLTLEQLGAAVVEVVETDQVDETIPSSEIAQRNASGQIALFVDKAGTIVDRNNLPRPSDYNASIEGVSLNFNPEDEFTARFRYKFSSDSTLHGLAIHGGFKYAGPAKTSVLFRSVSPLNELSYTPEVAERYVFDLGASYAWGWDKVRFRLNFNVYNLTGETYSVTTTTLNTPNPITGKTITRRTEQFYEPTSYRIGLSVFF